MLVPNLPCPLPVEALHAVGIKEILGIKVEDFDLMHAIIYWDEVRFSIERDASTESGLR